MFYLSVPRSDIDVKSSEFQNDLNRLSQGIKEAIARADEKVVTKDIVRALFSWMFVHMTGDRSSKSSGALSAEISFHTRLARKMEFLTGFHMPWFRT